MQTVIVGNGIVALSTAFRLLQRAGANDRIVVVAPRARPGSATLAAAAMLNSFAEIDADGLDSDVDLYHFELSHLATRMWPKFELELIEAAGDSLPKGCAKCQGCTGGGCFDSGTYVINNTAADDLDDANFDAILKALDDFSEQHALVSPSDIPNYNPEQHFRATRAVYIHNEGWFNPRLMLEKIDALLARDARVSFVDSAVDHLRASGGRIEAAVAESGEPITGDSFVLASGASLTDVIARSDLGIEIQRIFYGVGVSIEVRSPDFPHVKCIRTPNRGLACGLYTVPYFIEPDRPNDHVLIGASNFISPVPYPYGRMTSVESLMRGAMEQINRNFYRADVVRVNVGWRPTSQDTYPLLGRSSIDNLVIAGGTKRDGFHLAPLISKQIADIVLGDPVDERLAMFAPERKPIRILSREQAIEKAVRHQVSAAYQHGFSPSKGPQAEQIRRMYREDLERLHDSVGAVDWGIPPEMLDMYRYGHAKP